MLKCEIDEEIGCKVEVSGELHDTLNDVLNLIQGVHAVCRKRNLVEGVAFRVLLMQTLNNSSAWAPVQKRSSDE